MFQMWNTFVEESLKTKDGLTPHYKHCPKKYRKKI